VAAPALRESLIAAGERLLRKTDELGLEAQGAAWIYDHQLGEWRFFLVTSLVDTLGRRTAYKELLRAFAKIRLPAELSAVDVHLASPEDVVIQALAGPIEVVGDSRVHFVDCRVNGVPFDACFYRWSALPGPAEVRKIERSFRRNVDRLYA
jgi:hypothetical protein